MVSYQITEPVKDIEQEISLLTSMGVGESEIKYLMLLKKRREFSRET